MHKEDQSNTAYEEPIVDQVVTLRRSKKQEEASIEEAKSKVPELQDRIISLVRKFIPEPPALTEHKKLEKRFQRTKRIETRIRQWRNMSDLEVEGRFPVEGTVLVPSEEGDFEVKLSCANYPHENPKNPYQELTVDVEDLDHVLIVKDNRAILQSKDRKYNIPDNPVIGGSYRSWPFWERPINMKDLTLYSQLFDVMQNQGMPLQNPTVN